MKESKSFMACRVCTVLAAIGMLLINPAQGQEIKIGGTGNALGTMRLLGDAYTKANPGVKITILSSLGSSGAIKAVPKGVIDIGLASRELSDTERAGGSVATEYARSPTVLAVSTRSHVTAITRQQIADIYTGKMGTWPDGSTVRVVLRQPGDDNTRQIRSLSPDIDKAVLVADKRPGLPFAVIDQEAADKTESIPGAIGVTTLGLIKSENRPLRALKLDGVEPSTKNGVSGEYPLTKRFFFITKITPPVNASKFMAFVKSPPGREILGQTGHWVP